MQELCSGFAEVSKGAYGFLQEVMTAQRKFFRRVRATHWE